MTDTLLPVILCGGAGTRLWPLSRTGFPKQFLCVTGNESLFQQAARRLVALGDGDSKVAAPYVVTNEDHRFLVHEQLREAGIDPGVLLLEPVGRNTAPALTLAALAAQDGGQDPILVVTPADHVVGDLSVFTQAMRQAATLAAKSDIVILGIVPARPETGYGYIQVTQTEDARAGTHSTVERFVEKPDAATAQAYLDQGGYYWNAGMFVLKASVWLAALERFRPDVAQATRQAWAERSGNDGIFCRPAKASFSAIPSVSIDYAVMEHCPGSEFSVKMVPLVTAWSDLGAWQSVWQVLPKDDNGNAHLGDVITSDSHNTLVHASSRLVSVLGVDDLIVVETPDAVLVTDHTSGQNVKQIVAELATREREEHVLHRKVYRPWGWYDSVDEGTHFKVKRIHVNPKASLSLQKHRHRAEHWIVVAGTAEVTRGDQKIVLHENQSTYIPQGETHRLANLAATPLEIIEVQSGSYLGEDDIVRFEDNYGRDDQ